MKYKLYIFDLDGTILDTLEDLTDSTNYALYVNHMPGHSIEEVRNYVGNGIGRLIERAVPAGTPKEAQEKVLRDFREHYGAHCTDKTKPYDGIVPLIRRLRESGCMTAVVSNKADFAVQSLCRDYFPGLFDFVVGEREGIRRKPFPDSVLEVLETLQVDRADAVYVGDSEVDIQTAQNAGLDMLAVGWGFRGERFLKEQGARTVLGKPEDILEK